jgi:hypothetical protein
VHVYTEKSHWRAKQKLTLGERDLEEVRLTIERDGPQPGADKGEGEGGEKK